MSPLKSRQYCSVCKQWLEMEVVQTGDGDDDDGVVWFRCPQCEGFLPKLGGADESAPESEDEPDEVPAGDAPQDESDGAGDDAMPWDSPAEMMAARDAAPTEDEAAAGGDDRAAAPLSDADAGPAPDADSGEESGEEPEPAEPVAEYAARLAALDVETATPYRPWDSYEVDQCIMHVAWDDCGVVVGKEELPGGRRVIKCYFAEAGVVRLIEDAPR